MTDLTAFDRIASKKGRRDQRSPCHVAEMLDFLPPGKRAELTDALNREPPYAPIVYITWLTEEAGVDGGEVSVSALVSHLKRKCKCYDR